MTKEDKGKKDTSDQTVITSVEKLGGAGEKNAYILFLSGPLVGKLHQLEEGITSMGRSNEADIFIRPSLSEGFGNSFIEAMAAGLPVIATPVGGIVDFLESGSTGLFCEVHNPQSIAKQVEWLIADELLRKRIILNANSMVRERYQWDLIAKEMKNKVFGIGINEL